MASTIGVCIDGVVYVASPDGVRVINDMGVQPVVTPTHPPYYSLFGPVSFVGRHSVASVGCHAHAAA